MAYDSLGNERGRANGGDPVWAMHQMQSNPKGTWPPYSNNSENNNWNAPMVTGSRDSVPYPGYPSNYWYPPSHPAGPYSNTYSPGTEVNGQTPYNPQAMPAYHNGVYSGALHPSNPFYCGDQPPGTPPYPSQGCPNPATVGVGQHPSHHQRYPVPHCQGAPGYPPASYSHYGDGVHSVPQSHAYPAQPAVPSRPPAEAWSHPGGYGHPSHQQWQPGPQPPPGHYGNPFLSTHHSPWPSPEPATPQYDPKQDSQYCGYSHPNQPPHPGGPKPRSPNPNPGQGGEYSAPPQLYGKTGTAQEPAPPREASPPSDNPGLSRVQQVLARVGLLEEDVDEFVGHKTDKSYRCLEELLTKELLELDSVETGGQDLVRQTRKEAVQKVQGILDRLERKAF
ncbi:BAG family molecular chaperone regulator 4 isoform X1 [Lepisosteus oculatus]|uniref:BAG family molecular chaperone regulator 4 isoform X1 n=1 Tax=Lepisosteus oculatus TaxID=7918 RepID=UPI0035F51D1C